MIRVDQTSIREYLKCNWSVWYVSWVPHGPIISRVSLGVASVMVMWFEMDNLEHSSIQMTVGTLSKSAHWPNDVQNKQEINKFCASTCFVLLPPVFNSTQQLSRSSVHTVCVLARSFVREALLHVIWRSAARITSLPPQKNKAGMKSPINHDHSL